MSQEPGVLTPCVDVVVRVVPAGIERRGESLVCLATLSLMPSVARAHVAANPGETAPKRPQPIDLRQWPSAIQTLLANKNVVRIHRISTDGSLAAPPLPSVVTRKVAIRPSAAPRKDLKAIDALWANLVAGGNPFAWAALAEALTADQKSESLDEFHCGAASGGKAKGGNAAAPPRPDVFAYPRADAALLYGLERAREVLRALQGRRAVCGFGGQSMHTGGRHIDAATLRFAAKPWLGLDGPLTRLAMSAESDVPFKTTSLGGFAERDRLLAQERSAQEAAYRRQMGDKAAKAEAQAKHRNAYLDALTPEARVAALRAHAAVRATSLAPSACADACAPSTDDSVAQQLTDDVKAAHSLGTLPDIDASGMPLGDPGSAGNDPTTAVKHRFFAIQSMPSLARLFNLSVDIEFEVTGLLDALRLNAGNARTTGLREWGLLDRFADLTGHDHAGPTLLPQDVAHYLFVSADLQAPAETHVGAPQVWTMSKFRHPDPCEAGDAGHFWPCTREEVDLRLAAYRLQDQAMNFRGADLRSDFGVAQVDGVVDLGAGYCQTDGTQNPRYDIVSLDTIQTVESDIQSDRRMAGHAAAADRGSPVAETLGVHTRRTGGLALLDRWRQDHVVSQATTALFARNATATVVLDAEDLTAGYRLDVGVQRAGRTSRAWRSLMNRTMRFVAPGEAWLDAAVSALYRWPSGSGHAAEERRLRADSASLAITSRIRDNGSDRQDRAAKTVFAEQIMIAWHGDPLGLDCLDPYDTHEVEVTDEGFSMPAEGLPLEIHYGLPTHDAVDRPPPLRYGWPYHFGLRPVYLAGVTLPLPLAVSRYEHHFSTGSALPRPDRHEGRRFLRHERIEAPILTVPAGLAAEIDRDTKPGRDDPDFDRASLDTGATCLLRTARKSPTPMRDPFSTLRILVPPVLSLEQVALHGAFDGRPVETVLFPEVRDARKTLLQRARRLVRPVDGLKAVDFSGDEPRPGVENHGGFPHHVPLGTKPHEQPRGPAVFRLASTHRPRRVPFYPDPAAAAYVVVARRPGSRDYLCDAVSVPVAAPGHAFPDVLPLALEVRKRKSCRSRPATSVCQLVVGDPKAIAHVGRDGRLSAAGTQPVRHLVLELAPGEDFELEIWCAPTTAELRKTFDIVESLAVLLMRDDASAGFAEGRLEQACVAGLQRLLPGFKAGSPVIDLHVPGEKRNPLCGPGGFSLPMKQVLEHVAEAISSALHLGPVPEVAATTLLRVTHAVDVPCEAPRFAPDADPLRIVRLTDASTADLFGEAKLPRIRAFVDDTACYETLSDDGATNALFAGCIAVDTLTTQDVEVRAEMVSPSRSVFDDPKRGRTLEERLRGAYRRPGYVPDLARKTAWPTLKEPISEDEMRNLYGFSVQADGRVVLPRQRAPLAFLRDLPEARLVERGGDLRTYDLLLEQGRAYRNDPRNGQEAAERMPVRDAAERTARVQYVQPFHDGLARRLCVTLVASSRFLALFPAPREPSERELCSEPVEVWLPATRRPDRLAARSLRPSFSWSPVCFEPVHTAASAGRGRIASISRVCSIHLPFARPHFTSGEDERIGIVVWPPDLLDCVEDGLVAKDRVRREGQASMTIGLDAEFSDTDLGPGGPFVTRWGADPIREGPRPTGWLVPATAFVNANQRGGTVEIERNVLMPIPRRQTDPGRDAGRTGDPVPASEFLMVTLLTFEPRFDIDFEHWFIDVDIDAGAVPEPFLRLGIVRFQKHARRELQVSEPIAEWIQVMPKRTACVTATRSDRHADLVELTVEVTTPALYDGLPAPVASDTGAVEDAGSAPNMRATVLRHESTSAGIIQSIVLPEDAVSSESTPLAMRRMPHGTAWSAAIDFKASASVAVGYSVFVEEVQAFLSTADPVDAESGAPAPKAVETGPRFAAIVPVPLPKDPHGTPSGAPKHLHAGHRNKGPQP